jgi:hypothetical protein
MLDTARPELRAPLRRLLPLEKHLVARRKGGPGMADVFCHHEHHNQDALFALTKLPSALFLF